MNRTLLYQIITCKQCISSNNIPHESHSSYMDMNKSKQKHCEETLS